MINTDRKPFRLFLCVIIFCMAGAHDRARAAQKTSNRPNIIVILVDDIGYECFGAYGAHDYRTPNIDQLAQTGVRFEHCYAQPICTPSRVKMMTGRYNFRNYTKFGELRTSEVTFGNILKAAGYATAIVGKWQLGGDVQTVRDFGFDESCLWHIQGRDSRYWQPRIVENGAVLDDVGQRYGPDVLCDFALQFIENHHDGPFFLYYPMMLTHYPYVPTPDSAYGGTRQRLGQYDGAKGGEEYFTDMVGYTDKLVGRVVDKLNTLGIRDNTLILVTGDNGCTPNIVSRVRDRVVRGGKGSMTDAGTRVALIGNWPGRLPAGRVTDAIVDFSDFLPTVADFAHAPLPRDMQIDGHSFLPQLLDPNAPGRKWIICDYRRNGTPNKPADQAALDQLLKQQAKQREAKLLGRFARNQQYKLYDDDRFYDIEHDVLELKPIPAGEGSQDAQRARALLKAALDALPPWQPYKAR